MILKAQEVYFALNTSTVNKYEDEMTNSGYQHGAVPRAPCFVGAILLPAVRHVIFVFVHG